MRRFLTSLTLVAVALSVLSFTGAPAGAGSEASEPRIIGGTNAAPGEFPYQVALIDAAEPDPYWGQFCGGSLITPTRVLTASHCVDGETASSIDVLANTVLLSTGGSRINVSAVHMHPDYDAVTTEWDFAVLELASPAPGTPVAFATPADGAYWPAGTSATVTGWGNTVYPGPVWTDHLKKANVPVVANGTCSSAYGGIDTTSMFCAGPLDGGVDSCQGDSGGPLVVPGPGGKKLQIGIVSWGEGCALADYPGVYSRISAASAWIDTFMPPDDCGSFWDVPLSHPFCEDIGWLADSGVTGGFPDGSFRPGSSVTRQSMAAFLYRYAGEPAFTPPGSPSFPDVPTSHPFYKEIEWLAAEEVTGGFPDGNFRPGSEVTRQSMAAFLYRFDGEPPFTPPGSPSFPDVPLSHPFFDEIEWLADVEVTGGFPDGTFRPGSPVTRQAMAAFLHNYDQLP